MNHIIKKLFLIILAFFAFYTIPHCFAETSFALISDIHAGREKAYVTPRNKVKIYPSKAFGKFRSALKEIESRGIKNVIILGDLIEKKKRDVAFALKLKSEVSKHNLEMIWVTGNHDLNIPSNGSPKYFYQDIDNYRVIVLNNNELGNPNVTGGISDEQYNWLLETIKTDKKIILAGHHPIFDYKTRMLLPNYERLKQIIDSNLNIVAYLSGHWHESYITWDNGKEYHVVPPLTSKGYELWSPEGTQPAPTNPIFSTTSVSVF